MSKSDYYRLLDDVETWLQNNTCRHPEYSQYISKRNEYRIKIETLRRPVNYGEKLPYALPSSYQN